MHRPAPADSRDVSQAPGMCRVSRQDPYAARQQVTGTPFLAIYEASFPASERMPIAELAATLSSGTRWLLVAESSEPDPEPRLIGFAVFLPLLGASDFGILEYLATDPGFRSQGIGGRVVQRLLASAAGEGRSVVFEVEPDDAAAPNSGQRQRRIAFYRAQGAEIALPAGQYWMPDLTSDGFAQALPMDLWWATNLATSPPAGVGLRALIFAIFAESYGIDDPDHPVLSRIQAALSTQ